MLLAYADPPYLGCCKLYGHHHPEGDRPFDGRCWDDVETHRLLIDWLAGEFTGWALSMGSDDLVDLASLLRPHRARIGSWCKSFASFKPGINPAYTWEPVAFVSARKRERTEQTVRDFIVCPITVKKGLTGAKPPPVCSWILDLIGWEPGDHLVDVFPGTGAMGRAIENRLQIVNGEQLRLT